MGEVTGPPVGDMTLAGFAEVLKLQPKAVALRRRVQREG
jgi:hypothetical protein